MGHILGLFANLSDHKRATKPIRFNSGDSSVQLEAQLPVFLIGLARIKWYEIKLHEACEKLDDALRFCEKHPTFSDGNSYFGIIYLFLSVKCVSVSTQLGLATFPNRNSTVTRSCDLTDNMRPLSWSGITS